MKQHEQGKVVASDARTNSVLTEHEDYFEITGFCSIKECKKPYTLKLLKQTIEQECNCRELGRGYCMCDEDKEENKHENIHTECSNCGATYGHYLSCAIEEQTKKEQILIYG